LSHFFPKSNQPEQEKHSHIDTMTESNYAITKVPEGSNEGTRSAKPKVLSELSQKYDINGDGVLDETERASKMHSYSCRVASHFRVPKTVSHS
jgi:hypothetical protein